VYNTNTGVRIDPPGAQIDGDSGVKKIIGRVEHPNPPPGKSDPAKFKSCVCDKQFVGTSWRRM